MIRMEPTQFEKEFGIDLSSPKLDVIRGIEVGIEIEKRGIEFYSEQAGKPRHAPVRSFFEFMAGQEREHARMLSELKDSLKERNEWTDLKSGSADAKNAGRFFVKGKFSELDSILSAMKTEKATSDFYSRFSENLREKKGKEFFRKLAEWERRHYDMLNSIFEQSTEFRMET
jgi:rubrerythrin